MLGMIDANSEINFSRKLCLDYGEQNFSVDDCAIRFD